ncbi:TfoX/Sxy family protein [Pseudomarimonas arenosa]|uniref:TfoX/Sxy family protein n=1 Tax=Pseudomarimonas arenosa TaxID=2774145 RepID=A0AAW3ZM82_9GAMM|nr:TfoX/Sxy family protein [Pseudomarimonas arenosa]MBD8526172.1 TfoX/Sxy family protein [Pseudomarimonas arenosa]
MDDEIDWALELLSGLGSVRGRRMFGGWGLYLDQRMFALIADGELFLKVDDGCESAFRDAGCSPFVYRAKDKELTMRYFRPPSEALDSPEEMLPWARLAWEAAARAAQRPARARRTAGAAKRRRQ